MLELSNAEVLFVRWSLVHCVCCACRSSRPARSLYMSVWGSWDSALSLSSPATVAYCSGGPRRAFADWSVGGQEVR
jgi:hypothetical protein